MMGRLTRKVLVGLALAAALAGAAAAEEVRLQHEGLTLNARLQLADGKSLADGAILLTHGTLAHNRMEIISELQGQLRDAGHNTLAINLSLGLDDREGAYDCAVPHRHRHTDAVGEITAWVDWLKSKGAGEIVVLGHSRGGNQTAWYAAEHADPAVEAVVLIAPSTWSEQEAARGYESANEKPLAPILERARAAARDGQGAQMMEEIDILYCQGTSATADAFLSYYEPDPRFDTPQLLERIERPTLLIAGSEDTIVRDLAERVAPLADGERLQFVMLEGADHFFRDLYVDDIVEAVDRFLEGL
jgi:pimeloyl-ACP methyl ester carboxylesterase